MNKAQSDASNKPQCNLVVNEQQQVSLSVSETIPTIVASSDIIQVNTTHTALPISTANASGLLRCGD